MVGGKQVFHAAKPPPQASVTTSPSCGISDKASPEEEYNDSFGTFMAPHY